MKRTGWDSNPRYAETHTRFPSVLLKPLGHLSGGSNILGPPAPDAIRRGSFLKPPHNPGVLPAGHAPEITRGGRPCGRPHGPRTGGEHEHEHRAFHAASRGNRPAPGQSGQPATMAVGCSLDQENSHGTHEHQFQRWTVDPGAVLLLPDQPRDPRDTLGQPESTPGLDRRPRRYAFLRPALHGSGCANRRR